MHSANVRLYDNTAFANITIPSYMYFNHTSKSGSGFICPVHVKTSVLRL